MRLSILTHSEYFFYRSFLVLFFINLRIHATSHIASAAQPRGYMTNDLKIIEHSFYIYCSRSLYEKTTDITHIIVSEAKPYNRHYYVQFFMSVYPI